MEAPPGIEPGVKILQTSALPLGYGAVFVCSSDIIAENRGKIKRFPRKNEGFYRDSGGKNPHKKSAPYPRGGLVLELRFMQQYKSSK